MLKASRPTKDTKEDAVSWSRTPYPVSYAWPWIESSCWRFSRSSARPICLCGADKVGLNRETSCLACVHMQTNDVLAAIFLSKDNMEDQSRTTPKRKIHSKNEFELCYLRHQYLRRVKIQPTQAEMAPYLQVVGHQAKNTYYTYRNLFRLVGFEVEDLVAIAQIHLVSFLGLYSLEQMPHKYVDFLDLFWNKNIKDATAEDVESKNKANLTLFMKQRMEDVVRVCRQKARNIKGMAVEEFYVFYGPKRPPKESRLLLEDHEKFGYRKLDLGSFKSIKKKMKIKSNAEPFKAFGYWYIAVPLEKRNLTLLDFAGAGYDPYDSLHNKNPEEILFDKVRENEFEEKKANFESLSDKRKENVIRHFIRKNKGNPQFSEEIASARKMLKDMRD